MTRTRLDELFDAAGELAPEQRAAWLDAACTGDPALRRALARLLAADARTDGPLESGPALIAAVMAEDARLPQAFGVWRVQGALGAGGMGEVWLAERDDAGFVQRAAIKQVAYPTPGLLHRFARERQILARLEHPGIARLIDGGVDTSGGPWLAMEYVEGTRIDCWARQQSLDVRATVRLLLQVCDAVQFAHRNLVVHSDIKPSNILVADGGKARLLDFGIATVLDEVNADGTRNATRLMTPDYAAPEWLAGGAPTTAIDVYALGVLAYELLVGRKPERPVRTGGSNPANLSPTRPPNGAIAARFDAARRRRRLLRGDLDRVVLTAMAAEPARRYATVAALATDLRAWLDGRTVSARGDSPWYRLRRLVRRNRVASAAVAIAVVALVAATVFSLQQARTARVQAAHADAVRDFLVGVFEQTAPDERQGHPITARQLLEAGERQLAAGALGSNAAHAGMGGLIGYLYWQIGDYPKAETLLGHAVANPDPLIPADVHARNLLYLARTDFEKERLAQAKADARRALRAAGLAGRAADDVASGARRIRARALTRSGDARLAEPLMRQALAVDRARFGAQSTAVAEDLAALAAALGELGRFGDSIDYAQRSIQLATALFGRTSIHVIEGLETLASSQSHTGDPTSAAQSLTEAVQLATAIYGPAHRETIVARSNLYLTLTRLGRFEEALAGHRALLPLIEGIAADRPEQLAYNWNYISFELAALGHADQAIDAAQRSLAAWKKVNGPDPDWSSSDARGNLARALTLAGRFAAAEKAWRAVVHVEATHEPSTSPWLNRDRGELGNVLRLQRRYPEAIAEIKAALQALPATGQPDASRAHLHALLALAQLEAGDVDAAADAATRASRAATALYADEPLKRSEFAYANARIMLARGRAAAAVPVLRAVLDARGTRYRIASDPRLLEVRIALASALRGAGKTREAQRLDADLAPLLAQPASRYLSDLRARLDAASPGTQK